MLHLLFHVGESRYAIAGDDIQEVVPNIPLMPLPSTTSPFVVGILNYGGVPVPIVDYCLLLDKPACPQALHTRLIILRGTEDTRPVPLGLRAEMVTAVFTADESQFQEHDANSQRWPFLAGVYSDGRGIIQLVDVKKLLPWVSEMVKIKVEELQSVLQNL